MTKSPIDDQLSKLPDDQRQALQSLREVILSEGDIQKWSVEEDFINSIRHDKPVTLTSFEDGLKYMIFTDAVHKSITEKRIVDLDEIRNH